VPIGPGPHRKEQQSAGLAQGWPSAAQVVAGAQVPAVHTREQQATPALQAPPFGRQAAGGPTFGAPASS
jgi:hypothetical protein